MWPVEHISGRFTSVDGDEYRVAPTEPAPPGWVPVSPDEARWLLEDWRWAGDRQLYEACGITSRDEWLLYLEFERVKLLRRERPATEIAVPAVVDLRDLAGPEVPELTSQIDHYIEVLVLDDARIPCEGVSCRITTPDGRSHARTTDEHGLCRVDDIARVGACLIELPDLDLHSLGHATDALHEFVALTVRAIDLRLHGWQWQRIGASPAQLEAANTDTQATDDGGEITFTLRSITPDTRGSLATEALEHGYVDTRTVVIAPLEPVDHPRGQRARLDNLGYVWIFDDEEAEVPSIYAIEEFQCDHGLPVDGACGPTTQAKLVEVHGH
jgi:hypothetical protein